VWLDRLEGERENLRAALDWSVTAPDEAPRGLALAVALGWFWYLRGYRSEGRARLEALLAKVPPPVAEHEHDGQHGSTAAGRTGEIAVARARGLSIAGIWLLFGRSAGGHAPDRRGLYRRPGHRQPRGYRLGPGQPAGGDATRRRRRRQQVPDWQEALTCFASANEPWGVALARSWLGALALEQDNLAGAADHLQASIDQFRRLGDRWGIASTWTGLATSTSAGRCRRAAEARFREQQVLARALGHRGAMAGGQASRGPGPAPGRRPGRDAASHYERSISLYRAIGERRSVAAPLDALARLLAREQGTTPTAREAPRREPGYPSRKP
jgi:hypothetical protein